MSAGNMSAHLGLEFTAIGEDFIEARLPVDDRTRQPYGILHGGASVVLAETLGSVASHYAVNNELFQAVGIEVNANHIRSVKEGYVYGICKPVHLGGSTQVWEIRISDEKKRLTCISRLTVAIIKRRVFK